MSENGRKPRHNTLTACVLARDEEELLLKCLKSLELDSRPIWDELLVGLDDRTTDRTEEIALAHGARVIPIHWPEDDSQRDFAAARNVLEVAARSDYVYVQDADEELIAGHQAILDIVVAGRLESVRPVMVFTRDEYGKKQIVFPRQDVLHRRGTRAWKGKLHEWTDGAAGEVRSDIEIEQLLRPGGDRPHGDTFASLRANLNEDADQPWHERHVFYLAREHAGTLGHEQECVALVEALLARSVTVSQIQRSHACLLAAECSARLGEPKAAHMWYLRAIDEWAAWAEPHYALGVFCYEIGVRQQEEGASFEVCRALFNEAVGWLLASTAHEPPGYFVDMTVYGWRRYQALAVALSRVGRLREAHLWMQRAIAGEPGAAELRDQLAALEQELSKRELVSS